MSNGSLINLKTGDKLYQKIQNLGNSLKPVSQEYHYFFEIVRELMDSTLSNYVQLKTGYEARNYPLAAWACRNLLELSIFIKYVLLSAKNATRFGQDRLIDGCDILIALKQLERYYAPASDTPLLDDLHAQFEDLKVKEGVNAKKHLETSELAKLVGMEEEYRAINRVCSKLVHPSAWSVLAVNVSVNELAGSIDRFLGSGLMYMSKIFCDVSDHNSKYGMSPL